MDKGMILGIETSTDICSVALFSDGEVIGLREGGGCEHARFLAPYIDGVLRGAGVSFADLAAVAVSAGPGSYTGLRIGVSTAKGLCYALGIPLIAVGSLDALAGQIAGRFPEGTTLCPMIDARRMEVYTQLFDHCARPTGEVKAVVVDGDSFAAWKHCGDLHERGSSGTEDPDGEDERAKVRHPSHNGMPPAVSADERMRISGLPPGVAASPPDLRRKSVAAPAGPPHYTTEKEFVIFGTGAAKCAPLLPWARYIEVVPSARGLAHAACEAFAARRFVDTAYFEPLYLKDFVATTPRKKVL